MPPEIERTWERWKRELPGLAERPVPRCYFPKHVIIRSMQLHGFADASEAAYAGVVYLRFVDSSGGVHIALVISKTKVAPIKRLTIPRLELCGAVVLADLLSRVKELFDVSPSNVFAWTDSMIVLGWLRGSPRRFKPFVGNRVSTVMELVPPDRWRHVNGQSNPADCASRGLFPSELATFSLWWSGPEWLCEPESTWPSTPSLKDAPDPAEERKDHLVMSFVVTHCPLPILERISSFNKLKRVTAWILRFVDACRHGKKFNQLFLSTEELQAAENYWLKVAQQAAFEENLVLLENGKQLYHKSKLLSLQPFLDELGLMRLGGRMRLSKMSFAKRHPVILPGQHAVTKLVVRTEHLRLLHAGPTLTTASLSQRYHILSSRRVVRSITRSCVTCRRYSGRPQSQLLGQLPPERVTPGSVFQCVGVDYAGPVLIKGGSTRKPVVVRAYVSVFVSFNIKAVHLEPVSELTSAAFIAAFRRFIARRGKPCIMWSDHGTNFIGAARDV